MSNEPFGIGDLVLLSAFGRTVIIPNPARVGIVIAGPSDFIYECAHSAATIKYCTYDVMFGNELLTEVPEEFLKRMGDDNHVNNPKGLEELFDGSFKK